MNKKKISDFLQACRSCSGVIKFRFQTWCFSQKNRKREHNKTVTFLCRFVYLATSLFHLPCHLKNVDEKLVWNISIASLDFIGVHLSTTTLFSTKTEFVFLIEISSLKTLESKKLLAAFSINPLKAKINLIYI